MTRQELIERLQRVSSALEDRINQLIKDIEDGIPDVEHISEETRAIERDTPTMTVTIRTGENAWSHREAISDELPADEMGEILAAQVKRLWEGGVDPTDMKISIIFGRA